MIHVWLVFGWPSPEHEISLMSAQTIYQSLDKEKYIVHLLWIDTNANRKYIKECNDISTLKLWENDYPHISFSPHGNKKIFLEENGVFQWISIDIFFPILHGNYGEDGIIQGIFTALDTPFVWASLETSALCMNKILASKIFAQNWLATVPQIEVFSEQKDSLNFEEIVQKLWIPLFVKPSSSWSSIGVSKVHSQKELDKALNDAFQYDTKILIQKAISWLEVEVAIIWNSKLLISTPWALKSNDFYSYDEKYLEDNTDFYLPAPLDNSLLSNIKEMAKIAYQSVHATGFARIDFFVDQDHNIFINEINTHPGFTHISMFPKLFAYDGISNTELVDKIIELGFEQYSQIKKLRKNYHR